jgi:mono/diheme cytochrome c family protein
MSGLQWQITLGLVIVLATVGILTVVGNNEAVRMTQVAHAQRAQAIEVGADLYQIHCRSCHGAKGEGLGQLGPPLNDKHFFTGRLAEVGWPGTLEEYIVATTSTGRLVATRPLYAGDGVTVMTAWSDKYGGPLREDQIQAVAEFVLNWEATALGEVELETLTVPKSSMSDPEAIERGRQIFLEKGCADCHTIEGVSRADIGPALTTIAQVAASRQADLSAEEYIRESFLIPNAYIVEGYETTADEHTCGGILSERQLDELVAYLLTRR